MREALGRNLDHLNTVTSSNSRRAVARARIAHEQFERHSRANLLRGDGRKRPIENGGSVLHGNCNGDDAHAGALCLNRNGTTRRERRCAQAKGVMPMKMSIVRHALVGIKKFRLIGVVV